MEPRVAKWSAAGTAAGAAPGGQLNRTVGLTARQPLTETNSSYCVGRSDLGLGSGRSRDKRRIGSRGWPIQSGPGNPYKPARPWAPVPLLPTAPTSQCSTPQYIFYAYYPPTVPAAPLIQPPPPVNPLLGNHHHHHQQQYYTQAPPLYAPPIPNYFQGLPVMSSPTIPSSPVEVKPVINWEAELEKECKKNHLPAPAYSLHSDRRGGRTAWNSHVVVNNKTIEARYWYNGHFNARQDAAEVATKWLRQQSPESPRRGSPPRHGIQQAPASPQSNYTLSSSSHHSYGNYPPAHGPNLQYGMIQHVQPATNVNTQRSGRFVGHS